MNLITAIFISIHALQALPILLGTLASYASLDLAGSITSARGKVRSVWLGCGAVIMGVGMWTMHSSDVPATPMPTPVFYHLPTIAASLASAVLACGVALYVVSRPQMNLRQQVVGSILTGGGIAGMHYLGMAAVRCAAVITYDIRIVGLSILVAMATSFATLQLCFRVRNEPGVSRMKVMGAIALGSALPLMHSTGMWAAQFHPSPLPVDLSNSMAIPAIGMTLLSAGSFVILAGAIALSFVQRFLAAQQGNLNAARERELFFQTMAEAVPEIIWTATIDGTDDFFNRNWVDYCGVSVEESRGRGWIKVVHPEDIGACLAKWENALRTAEPYDVEYRLRRKDGLYRWFLGRANPIRNSAGEIVKWFGTCTDIESQKQNQQILEEQIQERTMQLADANTRLQEEMLEKDFARKELDQQNERMMAELKKRSERATLLAKMGELLQSCVSRDEIYAAALGFAPRIFPGVRGAVALLNAGRSLAEVIGSWTECRIPMKEFEPSACWALRTGHPHLVVAGDSTARCPHAAGVNSSYLCIPILAQGETLGVLHFQSTDEAPQLEPSELSFKTTFAGQVGLSIANIRLREALRTESVRDALTGLYNRRYLEEILDREIRRAGRAGQTMGFLMLDLDHFKRFNDTYGHEAGDAVLRDTAAFLLRNVRAEDFVCRFGGEEFVVILPTADLEGSRARGERLRSKMRELTVMHQGKSLGMVTVSIGVGTFPAHGMSPKELMAAADAALYEAKRGGRDRVAIAQSCAEDLEITGAAKAGWS